MTIITKPRTAPVNSKVTTKICWTLTYCICVIVIFWNQRLFITYVHATFDNFYPSSVTNCHKSRTTSLKDVTLSTYKLAITKYNLNFKLMYNHLFIPLNLWLFKIKLTIILNFCVKALQHVTLLTWTKVNRGARFTICWIRASQQKVKHHNRKLNFRFYMRNKKSK